MFQCPSGKDLYQFCKYCTVGAIGAVIDFIIYTLLVNYFQIYYLAANIFSLSIALIVVYYFQKNWTFRYVARDKSKTFHRYLLSVAITYIFSSSILFFLVGKLGYDAILSKIIQIILSTFLGYALTNFYVFKTGEASGNEK